MTVWEHAFTIEQFMLDFALVSALLLIATVARRYIPFLQRFLIPNSLTAGFLGLLIGPELLDLVGYSVERMAVYVFHLLALTFISVGLQSRPGTRSRGAVTFGFIQLMTFLIQAIIGLAVGLFIAYLINPDLVPQVGTLLPLGLGMSPAVAFSIGQGWEAFGFEGGGTMGLTVGAIGFLFAYGTGIPLAYRGIRRGRAVLVEASFTFSQEVRTGFVKKDPAPGSHMTFLPGAIEPLSFHLALIGIIYLGTYFLLSGLAQGLLQLSMEKEVVMLWSFFFIFANVVALLVRWIMDKSKIVYLLDEGLVHRTTGLMADLLICTSIMAISLQIASTYLVAIIVMCVIGTGVTYVTIKWVGARVFNDYPFERLMGIYGEMTGTISSGLAIVRVTDPDYSTPIAQDLVLGSGMALGLGFPLLLIINLPFRVFDGAFVGYWAVIGICLAALLVLFLLWTRFGFSLRKKTDL